MSDSTPRAQRHPLCTCPELTWDAATGRAPAPDLGACRARAFGGVDPHPVLTPEVLDRVKQEIADAVVARWLP